MKYSKTKYNFIVILMIFAIVSNVALFLFLDKPSSSTNASDTTIVADQLEEEFALEFEESNQPTEEDTTNSSTVILRAVKFSDPLKLYNYAYKMYKEAVGVHTVATGSINVAAYNVKQLVSQTRKIDNEGNMYFHSYTKKQGSLGQDSAEKYYIDKNNDMHRYASMTVNDNMTSPFENPMEEYTLDTYKSKFGINVRELPFIIDSTTILSSTFNYYASNKTYAITFNLSPKAAENYKIAVKEYGAAEDFPDYKSISITFKIDQFGRFMSIKTVESYGLKILGFNADVEAITNESIKVYNGNVKILDTEKF